MNSFLLDRSHCEVINNRHSSSRIPYPFQSKAFAALDGVKQGQPQGFATMLVLPTGAGKTYTAAHWILSNYIDRDVKVLWIAHRSELLRQAAEAFAEDTTMDTLPNKTSFRSYVISSEFGRSCDISQEELVIASRQSVMSGSNMDYFLKWAKGRSVKADRKLLIVLDEAHHAAAQSYRTIIDTMKKYVPHVDILGLTATPYRTSKNEQGSLRSIFTTGTGIAYSIDMNTLIKAGILANPIHIEVKTDVDMTKLFDEEEIQRIVRTDLSSLEERSLRKLVENTGRNKLIVDTYLHNQGKFGRTIVFAVDVWNAIALSKLFQAAGVRSDYVVSSVMSDFNRSSDSAHNAEIIEAFKSKQIDVLVNVNIVTEGTDIPSIQTVFLARPTTSKILMTQMIGRGLRGEAAGGTKQTNIVYFVDEWKGLVEFVSPKALLDGEDTMRVSKGNRKQQLLSFMKITDLENYAIGLYEKLPAASIRYKNIIPCGIISCSYLSADEYGNENEQTREILVYDEAAAIYEQILSALPAILSAAAGELDARKLSLELFFKYCESSGGAYIGVSSERIQDIILSYQANGELPLLTKIEGRVSLLDIAYDIYREDMPDTELDSMLKQVWDSNADVRSWYDYDFYCGMMKVYCNRMKKHEPNGAVSILKAKERMDMGELRKHYPAYYHELREYVFSHAKTDEEGYYYSAEQEEGKPPVRSKHRSFFEIDHIRPISKNGDTVKENLQLLSRAQNRRKKDKLKEEEQNGHEAGTQGGL